MNTVTCKHCGKTFELSDALTHEMTEKIRAEESSKFEKDLEKVRAEVEEKAFKKAQDSLKLELKNSQAEAEEAAKRNEKLEEQLLELSKERRILLEKDRDRAREMQRRLEEEEEKIRIKAEKDAEEKQHLLMAAKDKQLQDAQKELEDAKRKLQQGSQQTQGEVFELEFEQLLQKEFPHDKISPVGKGIRGGDIIQEVWDANGKYNGKILWELKNTKIWTEGWIDKLKNNKREIKAEEAVLISEVIPQNVKGAGFRNGVWVTRPNFVIGIASALRASLIQLFYAKESMKGKDKKVEILYSYLSGVEFKHRMEAIVEAFSNMQIDVEKEKRYFSSKWAKDEKNIRQVIDNTFGMHGDLKGIIGSNIPEIKGLDESDADIPLLEKEGQQNLLEE